jgi:hypothetical protein
MSSPCKHEVELWGAWDRISTLSHALADILVIAGDRSIDDLQARDEIKQIVLDVSTPGRRGVEGK